jgi:hypothetical protein
MEMNNQCKFCIHNTVCAYKVYYDDAVKLYEKVTEECGKYPWFNCKVECTQYRKDSIQRSIEDWNDNCN